MVRLIIDGMRRDVPEGTMLLEACLSKGIDIPHFCHHPDLKKSAKCRMCIVEVDGSITTSCNIPIKKGMLVKTDTTKIRRYRKLNLELMLSNSPEMLDDPRSEVGEWAKRYGITKRSIRFSQIPKAIDKTSPALIRDNSKCILCGKCVQKCQDVQGVDAIGLKNRSHDLSVCPTSGHSIDEVACVFCGQCTLVCPTGAIKEREYIDEVKHAIADPKKIVIVQTAPAVRVSIGETQGLEPQILTPKMITALRKLGFDKVLDTTFAADLTILEEGTELITRLTKKGVLPMITSCSPGWIRYIEFFYPELLDHVSTCKSPQQMFGAVLKTYYAEKNNIPPENIVSVSIMPCTAKKFEAQRDEMNASGMQDVDYVLTTRELGKWLNEKGIILKDLPDGRYDRLMGESTGAGVIFGATGGVMEAALRYAADELSGRQVGDIIYSGVRGLDGIKEAEVSIGKIKIKVAAAHGLKNARKVMEDIKKGKSKYHFIEIMACPGGCIGGGGQPIPTTEEIIRKRAKAIYSADSRKKRRKSQDNPEVKKLYEEFLSAPGSKRSHELLHTHYIKRKK